jgi:undecaprenyl-diphosphatase
MTRKSTIQSLVDPMPAPSQANPRVEAPARHNFTQATQTQSTQTQTTPTMEADGFSSDDRVTRIKGFAPRVAAWLETLQAADLEIVRILSRTARSRAPRLCAIAISKLGNGWFYLFLAAALFVRFGWRGYRVILLAAVNAAVVHFLYPRLKRRYRRPRPFKVDPELSSLLATLDEHSFPSGHAMTLTAVLTPIAMLWPAMAVSGALMVSCLAWSRVATAHHYPSDVIAGAILGLGLGYPISAGVMSIW